MTVLKLFKRSAVTLACLLLVSTILLIGISTLFTTSKDSRVHVSFYSIYAANNKYQLGIENELTQPRNETTAQLRNVNSSGVYFSLLNESTIQMSHKKLTLGSAKHIHLPESHLEIFISIKPTAKKHIQRLPTSSGVYLSLLNKQTSHKKLRLGIAERIHLPESQSNIFISIKTTAKNHNRRLPILLVTWLQTVNPLQVHILTDSDRDPWIQILSDKGYSVSVITQCKAEHTWSGLCCKSGLEYRGYYMARRSKQRNYKWFCHFDDDVYVNVAQLVRLLKSYDPVKENLYLGHYPASHWESNEIFQNDTKRLRIVGNFSDLKSDSFAYATGASYCISSSLMVLLEKYLSGHNFYDICEKLEKSDDLTVGIVISAVLGYNVTEVPAMMSEVEDQTKIDPKTLTEMITVGYRKKTKTQFINRNYQLNKNNRVVVPDSPFTEVEDPTGFLSFHCLLYPRTSWCLAKHAVNKRRAKQSLVDKKVNKRHQERAN